MPAIANPCCCSRCVVFRDDFAAHSPGFKNGLFGSWYANPALSSFGAAHHAWTVTFPGVVNHPSKYWMQVDNHYGTIDGNTKPYRLYYTGDVPRHFSASVGMRPIRENSIGSIVYANVYNDIGGPWYRLEVEASSSTYGDSDAQKSCGFLRIRRLLPNNLTVEVPVPGLCEFGTGEDFLGIHRVKLCYNPDTRILSGNVMTCFGEIHWVHTKSATPVPEHVSNLDPDAGTGVTNLWFEATNWGTLPSPGTTGVYIFDNFTLSTTKNTPEDFGYGYGYGYGDDPEDCPCCGGCVGAGFYFNDPANDGLSASEADCRILQSGTAVQSGGALSASSNTTLTWLGSHSGVGDNCLPAAAQSVTASINSAEYGRQITVSIGSVEATLTVESSEGAGDGTLSLSGVDPITVSDATINTLMALRLCVNADTLVASAGGKMLLRVLSDPPADIPVAIALDAGTILYGFDIDFGCSEDCTPDEADPPNDCDWCDGETVPTVLAFRPHIPSDTTGMADCNFCDLIHDRTFIMKYNLGCHYSTEGDLHAPLSDDDPCEWQPGCDAGPDSVQTCLTLALNTAIDEDTGHLVMSGLVMVFSNFFTCRIHFEQDFNITEERPDCQAFFAGVVRLPFKEFSGFANGVPCNLCGVGIESGPTDTSTWYLEVVGL